MANIRVFETASSLRKAIEEFSPKGTVGLVPTMGALHHGHIALVEKALADNDIVVVSIFVNPTQFNNPEDLEKYPRKLEADINLLEELNQVVFVYAPEVSDVYPADYQPLSLELGSLALYMEGEFRPGHFDGMVNVVNRLFVMVQPTNAYFGLKDFQQLSIVQFMVKETGQDVNIVPCDIVREPSGLASSSRNYRLSEQDQEDAVIIYRTLSLAKLYVPYLTPKEVEQRAKEYFTLSNLELEYFSIVNPVTLEEIDEWCPGAHACMAAYCGEVRLIDNLQMVEQ